MFCTNKLHSFILTHLYDGSHLEFCHVGFSHCQSWIQDTLLSSLRFHSKTLSCHSWPLTQTNSIWLKLMHSESTWWCQTSWILPSWIQPFCTKKLHSFILTQLDDGSHPEFGHVRFRHCHLGFRHLVTFSQIHSKTLSCHSESDSNSFIFT